MTISITTFINVVMLIVSLFVVSLSVVMLSVIMASVLMLSIITLSVVMLCHYEYIKWRLKVSMPHVLPLNCPQNVHRSMSLFFLLILLKDLSCVICHFHSTITRLIRLLCHYLHGDAIA